jgi:hypothetical protein
MMCSAPLNLTPGLLAGSPPQVETGGASILRISGRANASWLAVEMRNRLVLARLLSGGVARGRALAMDVLIFPAGSSDDELV